jgi:hypothetical protein
VRRGNRRLVLQDNQELLHFTPLPFDFIGFVLLHLFVELNFLF